VSFVSFVIYSITEGPFLQNIFWLAFEGVPEQLEALIAVAEDGLLPSLLLVQSYGLNLIIKTKLSR